MKLIFKYKRTTIALCVALTMTGCARFETRMQANGDFDYPQASLNKPYSSANFSNDEARDTFVIPELTEQQKQIGFTTSNVDVRPPTQFVPVIDGVTLDASETSASKVWFNAFKANDDMRTKVINLVESYLASNGVKIDNQVNGSYQIETGPVVESETFGSLFNANDFVREARYRLSVEEQPTGSSAALTVEVLSFSESNDGQELKHNLLGQRKKEIETRFINNLLEFAYQVKESEQLVDADKDPLSIKLGFDDNHQNAWIVSSEFVDTWRKIPSIFTLMNFDIVEKDKNLGYFLLKYNKPNADYWLENNLKPFQLQEKEYFVQFGELTGGVTSMTWLDEDKKPLTDQIVSDLYLSITAHLRDAFIQIEKQTQRF